jgi:general secretion pathway protein K
MTRMSSRTPSERGFVLLIVIWVTGLLALIAVSFGTAVRTRIKVTANTVENARAEALADAGVNIAIMDLVATRPNRAPRFAVDGTPTVCQGPTGDLLRIAVEDEAGKVDLNAATEHLLTVLMQGLGAAPREAAAHAGRILDFRDPDEQRRPDGAERSDYAAAGLVHGPKNAAFDTVDELDQVLNIPAGWIGRVRPFVTVYSGQGGIDPSVAPIDLLVALGKSTQASVAGGGAGLRRDEGFRRSWLVPPEFVSASQRRAFTVRSEARTVHGASFVREAVVELRTTLTSAHVLRRWRRGEAARGSDPEEPARHYAPC